MYLTRSFIEGCSFSKWNSLKAYSNLGTLGKFKHLNHNQAPADVSSHVGAIVFGKFEKSAQEVVYVLGYYSASAVNEMIDAVYRL